MATGKNIRTFFEGAWHEGDLYVMRAADHGSWLGSSVFDGARCFEGIAPDLRAHCARLNNSARTMGITPTHTVDELVDITMEGLSAYARDSAVYIRPMYWALHGAENAVIPRPGATGFCICLEEFPMPDPAKTMTLTTTSFHRPVLADAIVNAKAGCLYPNNGRMLLEARQKGFDNALVADALGNVAETALSNIFMVRDGEVFTPIANGTFLAGVTRARVIDLLKKDSVPMREAVLTFDDFRNADEVFSTGNMYKVMAVSRFEDRNYQSGRMARLAREHYWDWAHGADHR